MDDLAKRLANRVQLTSDGHKAYLEAVGSALGSDIDYAMLVKIYGPTPEGQRRYSPAECIGAAKHRVEGKPDPAHISTTYAARQNLNIRMGNHRITRLTNAFSKKAVKPRAHDGDLFHALQFRSHQPNVEDHASDDGVTPKLWKMADMVEVLEDWERRQDRKPLIPVEQQDK